MFVKLRAKYTDDDDMGRRVLVTLLCAALVACWAADDATAWTIRYREQFYQLYHRHATNYPLRIRENIFYLEQVLAADYANPLYALARIDDEEQWAYYRAIFDVHIYLTLCKSYLTWAAQYIKFNARFYNAPWRDDNIASLSFAEELLEYGRLYWDDARRASDAATGVQHHELVGIEYWVDEHVRIQRGELNYDTIIDRYAGLVADNLAIFRSMDENTY